MKRINLITLSIGLLCNGAMAQSQSQNQSQTSANPQVGTTRPGTTKPLEVPKNISGCSTFGGLHLSLATGDFWCQPDLPNPHICGGFYTGFPNSDNPPSNFTNTADCSCENEAALSDPAKYGAKDDDGNPVFIINDAVSQPDCLTELHSVNVKDVLNSQMVDFQFVHGIDVCPRIPRTSCASSLGPPASSWCWNWIQIIYPDTPFVLPPNVCAPVGPPVDPCLANPAACSPPPDPCGLLPKPPTAQDVACPPTETGIIKQSRSLTCDIATPAWVTGSWIDVSNTCSGSPPSGNPAKCGAAASGTIKVLPIPISDVCANGTPELTHGSGTGMGVFGNEFLATNEFTADIIWSCSTVTQSLILDIYAENGMTIANSYNGILPPFNWYSIAKDRGYIIDCAAYKDAAIFDGVCGLANGTIVNSQPTATADLCKAGEVYGVGPDSSNPNKFTWSCKGISGGPNPGTPTDASCSATLSTNVNGLCDNTTNGVATSTAPSANLCSTGTATVVQTTATNFTWDCTGTGTGTPASCSAPKTANVNGLCNPVTNGVTTNTAPSSNLCSTGTPTIVQTNLTNFTWSCTGLGTGSSAPCSAPKTVNINGLCNPTTNGVATSTAPVANLCSTGTATPVQTTTTTPVKFTWDCTGSGTGTPASCSAPKIPAVIPLVNGLCGYSNEASVRSATDINYKCFNGNPTSVVESGNNLTWSCVGTSGGTTDNCTATLYCANGETTYQYCSGADMVTNYCDGCQDWGLHGGTVYYGISGPGKVNNDPTCLSFLDHTHSGITMEPIQGYYYYRGSKIWDADLTCPNMMMCAFSAGPGCSPGNLGTSVINP